jgi:glycosyltransferase involved in cell wall biosynthesis
MRAVYVGHTFSADSGHLEALSQSVDLAVYGTTFKNARESVDPPPGCETRTFEPLMQARLGALFWYVPGLASALNEDRPDVIHVVSEPWGVVSLQVAAWSRRNPRTALVIHGCDRIWWHGGPFERGLRRGAVRWTLQRADGYAGESSTAVAMARGSGLAPAAATSVIHTNPRDPVIFRPPRGAGEKREARMRLGLPLEGLGVGFMARLTPRKGAELFLQALKLNHADGAWAVIAGDGPLRHSVQDAAFDGGAAYLGGLAFPEEVAAFYRAIDVFAVPSLTTSDWDEQGPRSVIEAMMSGCVVVGSTCGSIPEMLGDDGVIVRENDPVDLARGISKGLSIAVDSRRRTSIRLRAITAYSPQSVAEQMLTLWRKALALKPRLNRSMRPSADGKAECVGHR